MYEKINIIIIIENYIDMEFQRIQQSNMTLFSIFLKTVFGQSLSASLCLVNLNIDKYTNYNDSLNDHGLQKTVY